MEENKAFPDTCLVECLSRSDDCAEHVLEYCCVLYTRFPSQPLFQFRCAHGLDLDLVVIIGLQAMCSRQFTSHTHTHSLTVTVERSWTRLLNCCSQRRTEEMKRKEPRGTHDSGSGLGFEWEGGRSVTMATAARISCLWAGGKQLFAGLTEIPELPACLLIRANYCIQRIRLIPSTHPTSLHPHRTLTLVGSQQHRCSLLEATSVDHSIKHLPWV